MQGTCDEGYTLLEILAATAIIALMALPLSDSITIGLKAWSVTYNEASEAEQMRLTRKRIGHWLQNAYSGKLTRFSDLTYPMTGDTSSLQFVSPLHPDERIDDLYQINLSLSADGLLELQVIEDYVVGASSCLTEGETNCQSFELLAGVESMAISYMDPIAKHWLDRWTEKTDLPAAVRIKLSLLNANFDWPDLVVRPQTSEWAHCAFDAQLLACD